MGLAWVMCLLLDWWLGGGRRVEVCWFKGSLQIHRVGGAEFLKGKDTRTQASHVHLRPGLLGGWLHELGSSRQCKFTPTITKALISCWNLNILSALKMTWGHIEGSYVGNFISRIHFKWILHFLSWVKSKRWPWIEVYSREFGGSKYCFSLGQTGTFKGTLLKIPLVMAQRFKSHEKTWMLNYC